MAQTQSQIIADTAIRNAVYLEGLKANEVKEVARFLKKMDKSIRGRLMSENLEQWNRRKLEKLLAMVRHDIAAIQGEHITRLSNEVLDLAEYQAAFEVRNFAQVGIELDLPSPQQIKTAVFSSPMSVRGASGGKLMTPFAKDWAVAEQDKIVGAIRQGYFEGQSIFQIVQRIRGTKARNYRDGILETTRRNAEAIARTMVQHASSQARNEVYSKHPDVTKEYQWSSVLDSRTSPICRTLSGQIFEYGKGPVPPAHINCRSAQIPILVDDLKFLSKGRTQVQNPGGQAPPVSADTTYYEWLQKQPAAFQDSVLGPTRGKLFRDGGLSAAQFSKLQLGKNFKPLTLKEMRKLEPLAFNKAFPQTVKMKSPPKRAANSLVGTGFDDNTTSGKWSKAAFRDSPDWMRAQVAGRPGVEVTHLTGRDSGAWASRGRQINMPKDYKRGNLPNEATWRHEYGHILDQRMGVEGKHFAKVGLYRSAAADYRAAMKADFKRLKIGAGRMKNQAYKTKDDWVAARDKGYDDAQRAILRSDDVEATLRDMAKAANVDYKKTISLIQKETAIMDGFKGVADKGMIGAQARIAKIFKAIEYGDGQEFASLMGLHDLSYAAGGGRWRKGSLSKFSDLMGSTSNNALCSYNGGFPGHEPSYYKKTGFQGTENFANMTALHGSPNKQWGEILARFMPETSALYKEIMSK